MRRTSPAPFLFTRAPHALLATALCALAAMPATAQNSFGAPAPQPQRPQQQQQPQQQSQQQPQQQQQQPQWQQPQQQQPQRPLPPSAFSQQPGQQQAQGPRGMSPEQMTQAERQDLGVRAPAGLHTGAMHGPTPNTLPGGQVITTPGLVALLRGGAGDQGPQGQSQQGQPGQGQSMRTQALVFDVLGGPDRLPGALNAVPAHQAGSFDDNVQREFGQFLQSVTQGRQDTPLVFYCQSMQCWMSYNAALRAAHMGYRNVLWYRGGVEAWKAAGLPLQQQQQQQEQQQQQQPQTQTRQSQQQPQQRQ